MILKVLKFFLICTALILLFIALSVLSFKLLRRGDFRTQERHLASLQEETPNHRILEDLSLEEGTPINEIRYLATHNSYRTESGPLQKFYLNLGEPGGGETLRYNHLSFYEQLDLGIRSFELDPRLKKGEFENNHVPLVDNRSHSPSFRLSLEEMKLWSDRNPGHVPIITIIELKSDWMILDPALEAWNPEAVLKMDRLMREILGEKILTPAQIRGDHATLREALSARGWPELADSRGKFIFAYHKDHQDLFSGEYSESRDRVSFLMDEAGSAEASFLLHNDPDEDQIRMLLNEGYMVRTRADADCLVTDERRRAAILSGAQIVSTDFPAGYPDGGEEDLSWTDLQNFTP